MKEEQIKRELYTSPDVVVEIKAGQMLCGSPGEAEKFGGDMGGGEDLNF